MYGNSALLVQKEILKYAKINGFTPNGRVCVNCVGFTTLVCNYLIHNYTWIILNSRLGIEQNQDCRIGAGHLSKPVASVTRRKNLSKM